MKDLDQNSLGYVTIGREYWDVPVRVELRPFSNFTRRMNLQLRHLVERWAENAAPAARKFHRPRHNQK